MVAGAEVEQIEGDKEITQWLEREIERAASSFTGGRRRRGAAVVGDRRRLARVSGVRERGNGFRLHFLGAW